MKKRFFSRYSIKTPNSLINRKEKLEGKTSTWQLSFGTDEMCLHDTISGITSDIYLDAESIDEAQFSSSLYAENIAGVLDLSTTSPSMKARLEFIFDASPNVQERDFCQLFYLPPVERNIKPLNFDLFSKLFHAMDEHFDGRITRASQWLKRAQLEDDFMNKFIFLWTGLESINLLLCEQFSIPPADRELRCSKCNHKIYPVTNVGIKKLFTDTLNLSPSVFSSVRDSRVRLMHGQGKWDKAFLENIRQQTSIMRKALIYGICTLIHIEADIIQKILAEKPLRYEENIRILLKTKLLNFVPLPITDYLKQPHIEIVQDDVTNKVISKEGKSTLTRHNQFRSVNGLFDKDVEIQIRGKSASAIEKVVLR